MKFLNNNFKSAGLAILACLAISGCSADVNESSIRDDALLVKFAQWHLGFTTNIQQRDLDLVADAQQRWGLSELRFQQIWHDHEDGFWLYYETSQPDVRPDRNQIWRLYRNNEGALKVDSYNFKDVNAGLEFWGKGNDPTAFDVVNLSDLTTTPGCNATYTWRAEFDRFVGSNVHQECNTIGESYLMQHVEISKTETGTLVRNDWHTFYDENGIAKTGRAFKTGTEGPTIHLYTQTYELR